MIVEKSKTEIIRSGNLKDTHFNIKQENVAHLFSILRNQLYSDKIMAIIREYSTNAIDAHVEANVNRPISINVPTLFNTEFVIRDYGFGLSQEDIEQIYSSYGESTKRFSNSYNGMLGLGSKSAFAYSNTFVIKSRHNGIESVYSAYIDETDIGTISLVSQNPTTESGISIHINLKVSDIKEFQDKLILFYRELENLPEFSDPTILSRIVEYKDKLNPIVSGSNFRIDSGDYEQNFYVHMGNVVYPVHRQNFASEMMEKGLVPRKFLVDNIYRKVCPLHFGMWHIFAPIGSVSFTPDREKLQMDDKTKNYIFNKIVEIMTEIDDNSAKMLESCNSLWEKKTKANSLSNQLRFSLPHLKPYLGGLLESKLKSLGIKTVRKDRYDLRLHEIGDLPCEQNAYYFLDSPSVPRSQFRNRLRDYCKNNNITIKTNTWGYVAPSIYVLNFDTVEDKNNFKSNPDYKSDCFIDLETVEYIAPKKTGNGRKGEVGQAYQFCSNERLNYDKWKAMDQIPEKCVWVEISNFMPKEYKKDNALIETIYKILYSDMKCHFNLVGIKTADIKNVGEEWIELSSYVKTAIEKFKLENRENFEIYCMFKDMNDFWTNFICPDMSGVTHAHAPNYVLDNFRPLYLDYKIYRNIYSRYSEVERLANEFKIPFKKKVRCKQVDQLIKKFPILSAFSYRHIQYEHLHNKIKELL